MTPDVKIAHSSSLEVAVVQPNIHQTEKWKPGRASSHILSLLNQSKLAFENDVDLVVWPESATSSYLLQGSDFNLKWIQGNLNNSSLISGIVYYEDEENLRKHYNSAAHIEADTVRDVYHKLRLVPVGEYIPLSNHFTILKHFLFK